MVKTGEVFNFAKGAAPMTNSSIEQSTAHAHKNSGRFLEQFKELLRIPSISTDPQHKTDVIKAANWIVSEMERIGLSNAQAFHTDGHPVVYGDWLGAGAGLPTILFYAHYDVQPVDPLDLWETPPFEPDVRQGRIYARGVIDNKCGVMVNLQAVESILQAVGKLPVNLKFIFEGEEESGSPSMEPFVRAHKDLLRADLLVSSDGGSYDKNLPKVFSSLRGIITAEVEITGPVRDLHSGSYGGVVHNPAHMAAKIIAAAHDEQGRIQIPGFYDAVRPLTLTQLEDLQKQAAYLLDQARQETGLDAFWGVPEYTFLERQTAQPTLDVNGLFSGYQGAGTKTIIPSRAGFKASMRLVADQDPDDIAEKFTAFTDSFDTDTLEIQVNISSKSWPVQALFDGPCIEAVQRSFEATWGKHALLYRQGGSIPIMGMMQRELGVPITNFGYGNGGNGHAPNEFCRLEHFHRGIDAAIHFYHYIAEAF
jgi:acetylornithine deacetylase/succinyl-diaminopimelate desuccinylase-like protein